MDTTAYRVQQNAKARAARRTGLLQSKIGWQSRPRTLAAVAGVGPEAFYWKFLEYGTVKMDARPFWRPAAEAEQSRHQAELVTALEKANAQMERAAASVTSRLL